MTEYILKKQIEGIYTTDGTSLNPFTINSVMRTVEDVLQFQFIQHDESEYEIKILPMDMNNHQSYQEVIFQFKQLLGDDANVKLNIVPEIATLKSGKRPYIINHYSKE